MKNLFLLILSICAFIILPVQSQTNDLETLKKQVTTLKYQNVQLQKSINALKVNSKTQSESLNTSLKDMESKLLANNDSIVLLKKLVKNNKNIALVAIKSLRHRKTLFIWGAIIGIVIAGGVGFFMCKKYRSDIKKQEEKASDIKSVLLNELNSAKNDLQSQISSAKDVLEQKIKDQEKKINEIKK